MRKELILILGIFLFGFMINVNAAASSFTWVNFSVIVNGGENESAFNAQVNNFDVANKSYYWIYLTWDNPSDANFSHNLIFLDRILVGNTTEEYFNVTDLEEGTTYDISILPVSYAGEYGIRSSVSSKTLGSSNDSENNETSDGDDSYDGDSDDEAIIDDVQSNRMKSDDIPNFFVGDPSTLNLESGAIVLGDFSDYDSSEDVDWIVWVWGLLLFGILLFLILIILLIIRRSS